MISLYALRVARRFAWRRNTCKLCALQQPIARGIANMHVASKPRSVSIRGLAAALSPTIEGCSARQCERKLAFDFEPFPARSPHRRICPEIQQSLRRSLQRHAMPKGASDRQVARNVLLLRFGASRCHALRCPSSRQVEEPKMVDFQSAAILAEAILARLVAFYGLLRQSTPCFA